MSQVRSDVDLSALARPEASTRPPRRSKLRILVPLVLLLGFLAVLASTLTDLFRPVVTVTVVRPLRPNAEQLGALGAGTVVAQASGWVEPDPFLVHVPALAGGVVAEVLVQESDEVAAGDVVARLIEDDARIARDAAQAELALRQARLDEAQARLTIADQRLEAALEVTEALETARAGQAGAIAAAAQRSAAVVEGRARVALAEGELGVQRELEAAGASGARQVELAQGALDEARGRLAGLAAEAALADARVDESAARLTRAERDLELRFDDRLAAELARPQVAQAEGEVRAASAALEEAELRLARTEVRTPTGGIVLERLAVPGTVLEAAGRAVCSLYDPTSLRIRVDVLQGDVERLFVGQRAQVDADSRRGRPYAGEVLRLVQKADIAKVTLEAQVRVLDGDELLRPDMLAQVRFFGRPAPPGAQPEGAGDIVLVPRRLVEDGHLWVVAAGGRAERRAVELGGAHGDLVEVRRGVNLTDKLVDEGRKDLTEGAPVRVEGDAR